MYDAKAMGRRVRSKCVDRGITYKELAEGIGVPEGTVKSWVYGYRSVGLEDAFKIADYFGISLDELACRTVPDKPQPVARAAQGKGDLP